MPSQLQVWATRPKDTDPLTDHVAWFVSQGYRVQSQTDAAAQLVKPKVFSFVWAFFWFLGFGVGLIVYLIYYAAKNDKQVYLTVNDGKVSAA